MRGVPFLVAMALLVLGSIVGVVARVCPQDLRLEGGAPHAARTTLTAATAEAPKESASPVILPAAFTTVGDPPASNAVTSAVTSAVPSAVPTTALARQKAMHTRSSLPATRGSTTATTTTSASAGSPAIPDNPYDQASTPGTYGF